MARFRSSTVTFSYNPHYRAPPPPEIDEGEFATAEGEDEEEVEVIEEEQQQQETNLKQAITQGSLMVKTTELVDAIGGYQTVSKEEDMKWFTASLELVGILRDWRKTYKQLDQRKRHLKKKLKETGSNSDTKSSPLSSQALANETINTPPSTAETSANDKSESESDQAGRRPLKRRRMMGL